MSVIHCSVVSILHTSTIYHTAVMVVIKFSCVSGICFDLSDWKWPHGACCCMGMKDD